jgi:hypothetical protein
VANYIKATNFATKDTLSTGNPNKIIKGTEIDTEFNAIASAVASKSDINSPAFTGIPEAPTAASGTNTTQLATTAHVFAERTNTSTLTNKTLTSPTINTPTILGGSISGITDLAVADGGTGASTLAANNVLLGNGTSALQTVAPSTNGNFLRSNGTTWVSEAVSVGAGTVTSVATGNGLQGGTITSTGTLSVACPAANTVGSYATAQIQGWAASGTVVDFTFTFGSNYAAGTGNGQLQACAVGTKTDNDPNYAVQFSESNSLSGTWKWLGATSTVGVEYLYVARYLGLACRVS